MLTQTRTMRGPLYSYQEHRLFGSFISPCNNGAHEPLRGAGTARGATWQPEHVEPQDLLDALPPLAYRPPMPSSLRNGAAGAAPAAASVVMVVVVASFKGTLSHHPGNEACPYARVAAAAVAVPWSSRRSDVHWSGRRRNVCRPGGVVRCAASPGNNNYYNANNHKDYRDDDGSGQIPA